MHPKGVYYLAEQHSKKRRESLMKNTIPCFIDQKKVTSSQTPRQTPRLSLVTVKKAEAYPSAAAARSRTTAGSLRRPSVTSAPEISQLEESPTGDVPPLLIRQPEILPRV